MKVLKFGGTSVSSAENIEKVVNIIVESAREVPVIVVVSAFGGVTDDLQKLGELANKKDASYKKLFDEVVERHLQTAQELDLSKASLETLKSKLNSLENLFQGIFLINEFSNKTKDKVLSYGELLSSYVISEVIKKKESNSVLKDSRELITTDDSFTHAQVDWEQTTKNINNYFESNSARITLLPGFISRSREAETTTLGRGGSDFTAAIVASIVKAELLEIWTDVSGMYTANPKFVKQAFPIKEISYEEAMELSHFGAKVLYPPTVRPVLDKHIPIAIKNTFKPADQGTLITEIVVNGKGPVKGISHLSKIALLTLEGPGMVGIPGFSKRLFEALSTHKINVVLITQASSEHSICVAISEGQARSAEQFVNKEFAYEISLGRINPVGLEKGLAIVAVIGDRMKSHQGISGKMFSSLGKNNVNIRAIAQGASERNISAVIGAKDVPKALNSLHNRFFEKQVKTLNLYIMGVGNVGNRLLSQIRQQHKHLMDTLLINLKVVGLSNSRKMLFKEGGIALNNWQEALELGEVKSSEAWFQRIQKMNLLNSVFIDITANEDVALTYDKYFKESMSVVACNKIACASDYKNYQYLKELSRKYNASFLFETNVGAGLPVIDTLNNLVNSGDRITKIQAVLSGSLNFVFNNFDENNSFHDVVAQAQEEGYTEPDPRIDLSGKDVARKILILARESGYEMELDDIENLSFLPKSSREASTVVEFYKSLKSEKDHFIDMYKKALENNCRLKYVAEFDQGKAKVSLQEIPSDHPFYHLEGKDNIVLFYTERYTEQPLLIKGAGAGAEVTASGLFGDIIRLAKS